MQAASGTWNVYTYLMTVWLKAEPAAPPACAQGEDCGGQVWTDCGSSCPSMCGTPDADFCNEMCNAEFQCPNGQCFNDATGACEDGTGR